MTINGSTSSSEWTFKLEASETSYSVSNNTSTVKVEMYLGRARSQSYLGGNWSGSITVDGQSQSLSGNIPYPTYVNGGAWLYLGEKTYTVNHNADGSKTAGISASFSSSDFTPSSANASGNLPLTTIPRASSVTATNADIGSATSININRASSSFTHTLKYSFGSLSDTIVSKTSQTSYGWTVPTTFYAQIPNAKTGTCTITCETYNGNTLIGTKTTTFTVTANETLCKPTITGSVVDSNQTTIALTGNSSKLVKYYSNAQITFSRSAKNSASIVSTKINNTTVSSSPYTINSVSTNQFVITVTDSRGYSNTLTLSPTMINYIPLTAQVSFFRTQPTTGQVSLSFSGNYFNGSFGSQSNTLTLKWYYRLKGANSWTTGGTLVQNTDYKISGNTFYSGNSSYQSDIILGSNFDYQKEYEFKFEFYDKLNSKNVTNIISKGQPAFWWNDNKVQFEENSSFEKSIINVLSVNDLRGKNLFNIYGNINVKASDGSTVNSNTLSNGIITSNINVIQSYPVGQYIQGLAGKTITFSAKIVSIGTGESGSISIYDNHTLKKSVYGNANETVSITYTCETNDLIVAFGTYNGVNAQFSNIQVELGDTQTDYTEYKGYGLQSGSNSNGTWIKYDDGTLICYSRKIVNASYSSSRKWGIMWESTATDLGNYPYEFIEKPIVNITNINSSGGFIESVEQATKTHIGNLYICRGVETNTTVQYEFNVIAIGRWI